jgi:hypothetical protein
VGVKLGLTLREEHRVRVLRRIFGPKRNEVTGGLRKLHNEELHDVSRSVIRMIESKRMKLAGHGSTSDEVSGEAGGRETTSKIKA